MKSTCQNNSRCRRRLASSRSVEDRCALVLVIVLVAIALLSLAGYTFSELMLTEQQGATVVGRQAQARELTQSGGALLQYFLSQTQDGIIQAGGTYDNAAQFQGLLVSDDGTPRGRGRFSIVCPRIEGGDVTGVRFGLENESARINVNALVQWDKQKSGVGRQMLMGLPGMDETIADAILDWIDDDSTPRENGAEADSYANMSPPYAPTNGPIATIEELLKVRGVTPQLLFGADTNRNGMIDPGEAANAQLASSTGADPETNRGWAAYLTVNGKESNMQPDGVTPKIDINGADLQQLRDDLSGVLDNEEYVNFILAARLYGLTPKADPQNGQSQSGQSQSGQNQNGQNQNGQSQSPNQKSSQFDPYQFQPRRSPFMFVAMQVVGGGGGPGGGPAGGGSGGPGAGAGGGGRAGAGAGGAGGPGSGGAARELEVKAERVPAARVVARAPAERVGRAPAEKAAAPGKVARAEKVRGYKATSERAAKVDRVKMAKALGGARAASKAKAIQAMANKMKKKSTPPTCSSISRKNPKPISIAYST